MNDYTFCKKDGTIKKCYIDICEQITKAVVECHEIRMGRSDDIIDVYDCYTIPRQSLSSRKRALFESKVCDVCKCFNVAIKPWYSYWDITIELHGENVERMIEELSYMLRGDIHIRQTI